MEVITETVVSSENYTEIKKMLLSNDKSSRNMALSIMELSNFEKSKIYILCLIKEANDGDHSLNFLKQDYSKLYDNIFNAMKNDEDDMDQKKLSFKKIYELAEIRDVKSEIKFLLEIFKEELSNLLIDYGFSFLKYVDISITQKKK